MQTRACLPVRFTHVRQSRVVLRFFLNLPALTYLLRERNILKTPEGRHTSLDAHLFPPLAFERVLSDLLGFSCDTIVTLNEIKRLNITLFIVTCCRSIRSYYLLHRTELTHEECRQGACDSVLCFNHSPLLLSFPLPLTFPLS